MKRFLFIIIGLLTATGAALAELPTKTVLTLATAKRIAAAAGAKAAGIEAKVVIAVLNDGGYPMYLERRDGTQVASAQVAMDKARTAAIYRRPSKDFEDQVARGRVAALALSGAVPLQGGLPFVHGDTVVGAIGVSGEARQQDEDIARAGTLALNTAAEPPEVSYFDRQSVAAAFAKGVPLIETAEYKVHASRRTAPGLVEIHEYETDVLYVLQGKATFVTGGRLLDGKAAAPGEIRGTQLEGAASHELEPGDVAVVPRNTPHWFKAIHEAPFLYFVVKPIAMGGGTS